MLDALAMAESVWLISIVLILSHGMESSSLILVFSEEKIKLLRLLRFFRGNSDSQIPLGLISCTAIALEIRYCVIVQTYVMYCRDFIEGSSLWGDYTVRTV